MIVTRSLFDIDIRQINCSKYFSDLLSGAIESLPHCLKTRPPECSKKLDFTCGEEDKLQGSEFLLVASVCAHAWFQFFAGHCLLLPLSPLSHSAENVPIL